MVSFQQKKRRFLGLSALSVRHEDRGSARLSESKPSFLCQSPNLIIYQQLVEKTIVETRFLATMSPKTYNTHTHTHTHTQHTTCGHTHQPNWLKPKEVVTRTDLLCVSICIAEGEFGEQRWWTCSNPWGGRQGTARIGHMTSRNSRGEFFI